jgi:Antimicrobial peptide resistance and lipid A acylation protein PagP
MLRCAALVLAAIFSIAAPAAEPEESRLRIWVNPGMFSDHEKDDRDYREKNYGIGAEAFFTPRHGLIAGTFMNSNDERSRYLGYHWRPLQLAFSHLRFSGGLAFALIDGYSDVRDGGTFPIALPALSAEYRILGVHLIFIPHPEHSSALALQLRLRVW